MKATERFGSRVENYVKFRPGYPSELVNDLVWRCGLRSNESPSVIVDVGSGTGLSAELFLKNGFSVVG
ncbi:MAG: class I SAM-dependent methyltransferase, partial [Bdellovibrionaceae bacterium]|nr:class I SAM-dependent methyltransferase [Pseudobdellovibrionaceae bacterium]